jgi:DNA-binding HxlR family transcriptional regulator
MNLSSLQDLAELLRHRWDPIVLALVAERPRRYSELTRVVRDDSGERISDGVLSLTLSRLIDSGLLVKRSSGEGYVLYTPTNEARRRIRRLRWLSEMAARHDRCGIESDLRTNPA